MIGLRAALAPEAPMHPLTSRLPAAVLTAALAAGWSALAGVHAKEGGAAGGGGSGAGSAGAAAGGPSAPAAAAGPGRSGSPGAGGDDFGWPQASRPSTRIGMGAPPQSGANPVVTIEPVRPVSTIVGFPIPDVNR
jgi:hypothetical protein